jgi:predicted nucleic acid-binding protein
MVVNSKKIFIDSSFFLAFIDRANINHAKSAQIFDFLAQQRYYVYTSDIVVLQAFNAIERDLGPGVANDFLQAILESSIQVLYAGETNFLAALRYLKIRSGYRSTLSTIITVDLLEKYSIHSVLTFDFWQNIMGTTVSNLIKG